MTKLTIRLATMIATSEPLTDGVRGAAGEAAYELLAARLGIGPDDELDAALAPAVAALADRAARAGAAAARRAILDALLEGDAPATIRTAPSAPRSGGSVEVAAR